jgi:hypothetical protein
MKPRRLLAIALSILACGGDDDGGDTGAAANTGAVDSTAGGAYPCAEELTGTEGCQCSAGVDCMDPFICNPNLNVCIDDSCPVGAAGCPCTPTGTCEPDLLCLQDFCVDNQCPTGTEGCMCTPTGTCEGGLACVANICSS